jgi:hypothetical protein
MMEGIPGDGVAVAGPREAQPLVRFEAVGKRFGAVVAVERSVRHD